MKSYGFWATSNSKRRKNVFLLSHEKKNEENKRASEPNNRNCNEPNKKQQKMMKSKREVSEKEKKRICIVPNPFDVYIYTDINTLNRNHIIGIIQ